MSESQNTCTVKPLAWRGKRSGGGGLGSFSESRRPYSASFLCWLGMVRGQNGVEPLLPEIALKAHVDKADWMVLAHL